jgi:hypothetical protein
MDDNHSQKEIEKAIKAVLGEEKRLQRVYPEPEAVKQVRHHLGEQVVAKAGLGLTEVRASRETANVGTELAKTFEWAADQYIFCQLKKLRP